jgi:hypothetical protein
MGRRIERSETELISMAPDQIYRPISDEDTESETPSPQTELQIESYSDFQKAVKDHVGASDHELSSEEVADDITPRRQREEAPSPENASERPLVRMRSTGEGPLTLQEASDDIRFSRARQQGADLAASVYNQDQINEYARAKVEASLDGQPDNPDPPVEVKLHDRFGEEGEELTAHEAAERLTSWREEQERLRQTELAELVGQPQEPEQQAQQPQPEPQRQQPQAPDPVQTERAQIAKERQWVEYARKMDAHEVALRMDYDQLRQAVANEFPSLRTQLPTPEQVEQLRIQDPGRHQKLMMADQMLRERQARIAAVAQQRSAREAQQAAQEKAHLDKWAQAQNDIIDAELPELRDPKTAARFKQDVAETMRVMGITQEHLNHHLFGPSLRSVEGQRLLADATRWRVAQQKAQRARQVPLPPVQKPGAYRAVNDGAQSVRELQQRLYRASGREALRVATELTKARRANGG